MGHWIIQEIIKNRLCSLTRHSSFPLFVEVYFIKTKYVLYMNRFVCVCIYIYTRNFRDDIRCMEDQYCVSSILWDLSIYIYVCDYQSFNCNLSRFWNMDFFYYQWAGIITMEDGKLELVESLEINISISGHMVFLLPLLS